MVRFEPTDIIINSLFEEYIRKANAVETCVCRFCFYKQQPNVRDITVAYQEEK